jgi:polyisoprenoid-binding protein YceI
MGKGFALWAAALTLVILLPPAQTASGQAPPPNPSITYQVHTGASRVYIRVDKATRMGHEHGIAGQLAAGNFQFGGTGELVFDMRTFIADTPEARRYVGLNPTFSQSDAQKVNANMRGPDVLDVAKHPTATFKFTSFQPLDNQPVGEPGRYQCNGSFTLHGVTRTMAFPARFERNPQRADVWHLRGAFTIQQTAYGITPYSAAAGLIRLADQLTIWGEIVLTAAK